MINKRLFKHYGIDTDKDLKIRKICPRPYDTILIDKMGSCYACECQSWLPQSIGNLQVRTLHNICNHPSQIKHTGTATTLSAPISWASTRPRARRWTVYGT